MSRYIIDIEDKPVHGLYKTKKFRTLVFDAEGLRRLEKIEDKLPDDLYYYVNDHFTVSQAIDTGSAEDMMRHELGNYFKSFSAAFSVCERICNLLEWEGNKNDPI